MRPPQRDAAACGTWWPCTGGPIQSLAPATHDRPLRRRQAGTVVATCPAVRDYCIKQGIATDKIEVISSGGARLHRRGPRGARFSIGWACRNLRG